jgi:nuclear pore complex protein Nup188
MGTLIELASSTLDTLGHLISRPAGQALTMTSPTRPSERPLDVGIAIQATRRTVETVLFYATTQLAAWVTTPELLDAGAGGAEPEAAMIEDATATVAGCDTASLSIGINHHGVERRASRREPTVMTERMRRGLTGEISSELKAVLEKARTVLAKNQQAGGEKQTTVEIAGVLLGFLNQRVICST